MKSKKIKFEVGQRWLVKTSVFEMIVEVKGIDPSLNAVHVLVLEDRSPKKYGQIKYSLYATDCCMSASDSVYFYLDGQEKPVD